MNSDQIDGEYSKPPVKHDEEAGQGSNVPVHHVASLEMVQNYMLQERMRNRKSLLWVSSIFLCTVLVILGVFLLVGVFVMRHTNETFKRVDKIEVQTAKATRDAQAMAGKIRAIESEGSNTIAAVKHTEVRRLKERTILKSNLKRFSEWVAVNSEKDSAELRTLREQLAELEKTRIEREKELAELRKTYREMLSMVGIMKPGNVTPASIVPSNNVNRPVVHVANPLEIDRPKLDLDALDDVKEIKFANGDKYKGQFKNEFCHGRGIFTHASGDVYEGSFKDDMRHGDGTLTYGNGDVYSGSFLNNLRHGKGMLVSSGKYQYEGYYHNNLKEGTGILTFENGDTYNGEFKKDLRDGQGRYVYSDGSRYEGKFSKGKKHGRGIYTSASGAIYEGEFRNGKRDGNAVYTYPDGAKLKGCWKNGNFVGAQNTGQ